MEEIEETKTSLVNQGAWLMFAKLVGFSLSFLLPLLVTRILSKSDVGVYQQVFLVIATSNSLLSFGMGMSAFYYLSRDRQKRPYYVFNILVFNFVVGGIACLMLNLFPNYFGNFFNTPEMAVMAPQIGLVIWLWLFSNFLETIVIANQESKLATVFIILAQLTKMLLMVSAVYYFGTVQSMLNAVTIQVIIQTLVLLFYLNSRFKGFWNSFDKQLFIEQLKYATPFGLMGTLWILQSDSHNYFVAHRFSEEEMAVYRFGCFEIPLLYILQESASSVMIPRMSQLQAQEDKQEMINLSARATEKLSLVYFPVFVFLVLSATTLFTALFTKRYLDSVPIFLINIILLPFAVFLLDPISRSFVEIGRYLLKIRIVIVILMVLTFYFGFNYFDLTRMAIFVVFMGLVDRIVSAYKIWKTLDMKVSDIILFKNTGKIAMVSILAGIPTYFFHQLIQQFTGGLGIRISTFFFSSPKETTPETISAFLTLGITGLFFAIIYFAGIYFSRLISEREIDLLAAKVGSIKKFLRAA